nr:serine--pyruvate aminotransferase [Pelodiscus sinensis]|eukprot:XP_014427920.1 serine--pyruvate aminotransferase [Pelodiscus sinensis]
MDDIKLGIQYAFQTQNPLTLAISGPGHCAMEAALLNAVEAGEVVLMAVNGIWGERATDISRRLGADVRQLVKAPGEYFALSEIEEVSAQALERDAGRPRGLQPAGPLERQEPWRCCVAGSESGMGYDQRNPSQQSPNFRCWANERPPAPGNPAAHSLLMLAESSCGPPCQQPSEMPGQGALPLRPDSLGRRASPRDPAPGASAAPCRPGPSSLPRPLCCAPAGLV